MPSVNLRVRRAAHAGIVAVAIAAAPPALLSQSLTYMGSAQVSTGNYVFAQRTTSLYLLNGIALSAGRLHVSASLPIVVQDAGWVQYVGGGLVPSGGMHAGGASGGAVSGGMGSGMGGGMMPTQGGTDHVATGFGDPFARVEIDLTSTTGRSTSVRAVGAIKAPLSGVAQGFGTGEWDFGAGLASRSTLGNNMVLVDVTYWKLGDPPTVDLRDAVSFGATVGRFLQDHRLAVMATLSGSTRVLGGLAAPLDAGAGVTYRAPNGRAVSISVLFGLTRSAPAVSFGIGWMVPLRP